MDRPWGIKTGERRGSTGHFPMGFIKKKRVLNKKREKMEEKVTKETSFF